MGQGQKFSLSNFGRFATLLIQNGSIQQIRLDAKKFGFICRKMTECFRELNTPIRAIKPLRQAISKLDARDHLTPQHAQLALACILAKTYKAAIPLLDTFVYQIDPALTGVRSEDTRLYFYYGAICYIGVKNWTKAIEFFETVISAPAMMASAIMVEAYKKYVLVCLIAKGEVPALPRSTAQSVLRVVKTLSSAYDELATAYSTRSHEDLGKCADNHAAIFLRDGNMGLVGQVMNAMHSQNIKRLTKTYLTLSFDALVQEIALPGQPDAERRILKLVEDGQLLANIHQKEGYVSFQEKDGEYASPSMVTFLDRQIRNTITVHQKVTGLDRDIEGSEKYVSKLLTNERGGGRFEDDLGMMGMGDPSMMYRS
jgi:COP9 signalosome complex subunit 3